MEMTHEKAFDQAPRNCAYFRYAIFGDYARVRVGRLRSEPPSQWMGRMRLGRPKSRLVPEKNRPSSRRALPMGHCAVIGETPSLTSTS